MTYEEEMQEAAKLGWAAAELGRLANAIDSLIDYPHTPSDAIEYLEAARKQVKNATVVTVNEIARQNRSRAPKLHIIK